MLTNKELGEYLEKIRKNKDLSLRQVDYKSSVSYSHLSMIEKGLRKALPLTLKELAKVYNIDYIDLLEKAGYIDLAEKEKILATKTDELGNPVIEIPILGIVKAGYDYLAQENWIGKIDVDKKLADGNELFALKVKGDSMSPVLIEDDIVIVKKQDDFENGDIIVALINGDESTIKKGKKNENSILLQPLNTNYEPLIFTKEEMESIPVTIIGIVKQLKREF